MSPKDFKGRNPKDHRGRNPKDYKGRNPKDYKGRNLNFTTMLTPVCLSGFLFLKKCKMSTIDLSYQFYAPCSFAADLIQKTKLHITNSPMFEAK